MSHESAANVERPRTTPALAPRRRRKTPLARRRRLNGLVRELAADLGFDLHAVTRAEQAVLAQAATLLLQVEISQAELVGEGTIDPDTVIRLSSEARRLLSGLRARAQQDAASAPPPWSPLRSRINAAVAAAEATAESEAAPEPEAAI
jgi:hypothetical protein